MSMYARIEGSLVAELFETDGDITKMFPPNFEWVDVTGISPQPQYSWIYDGKKFSAPIVDYQAIAEQERGSLLGIAQNAISIWQTKLLLGRISSSEKASLNLWLDYIDAVSAIETSKAPDIEWPVAPS